MDILNRRSDGTFVALIDGYPYHVTADDPLHTQAEKDGADAPLEPEPEPQAPRRIGTPREFLALFTDAEKLAFFTAKAQDVALDLWWAEASTGNFSLDHPKAGEGLAALVSAGLLTQERADEIGGANLDAYLGGADAA